MSIKKVNEIFGYGLFIVGAGKTLFVILILINLISAFSGGIANSENYSSISKIIGFAQLILAMGSIIMIILNKKNQPEVISGYLLGLGALLIEFITPPILIFFTAFIECSLYMKAGTKIINENGGNYKSHRKIKQDMKNAEWFYGNNDK